MITRELLLGRLALGFGIVAFIASLLFAAHVFLSTPSPPSRPPDAPVRSSSPAAEPGLLVVSLFPEGRLDAVTDAAGRPVPGRFPLALPARLALPPGRYRVEVSSPRSGCRRTADVVVVSGTRSEVRETCATP